MSDVIIKAVDLCKVYRLYSKLHYRFLDMFGLLPKRAGAYTEHVAVDRLNIVIKRGEKVAVIGRNGAGKSTFLKLVSKVIEPTSGRIEVAGQTHALLQIGTGFHPDFTGRENVHGYLAHLGITGKEAEGKVASIVEFAELEEYIDQPLKTYSTGMAVRLMFSTSTAIAPDILVLDEVLGVGDAYFVHKSYDRIKQLCEGKGTTLLLVTHDVYSATKFCSRMMWMDRGRILMDGDAPTVIKAYEDSIREQEERRLRKKKQERLKALRDEGTQKAPYSILLEIQAKENKPQPVPVYFSRISLCLDGTPVESLPLGLDAFRNQAASHLEKEAANWGEPVFWEGREARALVNYGSVFHKVAGVFMLQEVLPELADADYELVLDFWSQEPCHLVVRVYAQGQEIALGALPPAAGEWTRHVARWRLRDFAKGVLQSAQEEVKAAGIHGSASISVTNVSVLDEEGQESHWINHGRPMDLLVGYRINNPNLLERAQVVIVFHRDGVQDVCRIITRDLLFDASVQSCGVIRMRLSKLKLADGNYSITVMVVREGYFDREQTTFYSLNPEVYACLSRVVDIIVCGAGFQGRGTVVMENAEWSIMESPSTLFPST